MTDDERAVLVRLAAVSDEYCLSFAAFDPMPRDRVRAACRSLAASGLALFQRGLMTEDGEVAGSGYGITPAGIAMARAVEVMWWSPFCECRRDHGDPIWEDPREQIAAAKIGAHG